MALNILQIKIFFILSFTFLVITLIGLTTHEITKKYVARNIGYESNYFYVPYGRIIYYSPSMQAKFQNVIDNGKENREAYTEDVNWVQLEKTDSKDHALIELSGKLFLWMISIMGFFIWKIGKKNNFKNLKWLGLILTLFFIRDVPIYTFNITRTSMLCDEAKLWSYFNLSWNMGACLTLTFSILLLALIFFKLIYKNDRVYFVICGSVGGFIGILIWLKFIGHLLV